MLAHVAVNVTDMESAMRFYTGALEPLGYRVVYEEEGVLAYYADATGLDFGVGRRDPVGGAHVAFACSDRATVDRVYEAALAAGGARQRTSRAPSAVRRELLRRVRPRRGRQQHRSRLPRARVGHVYGVITT